MTAPVPMFTNDDEAAQHWLGLLRDGARVQKVEARIHLATIFERRGMLDEAVELLETNVASGVRRAEVYDWLHRLYRSQGNGFLSLKAYGEAKQLRASEARLAADLRAERRASTEAISRGALYVAIGVIVTIGSFWIATNAGDGRYIILYGPVIAGGYLVLRGLADVFPRDLNR